MTALRQRKQGWPLEEGRSLDRWMFLCAGGYDLSLSDWGGAVHYQSLDLFSAVLEVPVFTVAGGGSLEMACTAPSAHCPTGIYPRLFRLIDRTCKFVAKFHNSLLCVLTESKQYYKTNRSSGPG
jgi:hypothetical protein